MSPTLPGRWTRLFVRGVSRDGGPDSQPATFVAATMDLQMGDNPAEIPALQSDLLGVRRAGRLRA